MKKAIDFCSIETVKNKAIENFKLVTEIVNLFCGRDGRDLISTINLMLEYLEILDREVLTTKGFFL